MGERAHGFEQQRQQTFENPEVQQLMVSHFIKLVDAAYASRGFGKSVTLGPLGSCRSRVNRAQKRWDTLLHARAV